MSRFVMSTAHLSDNEIVELLEDRLAPDRRAAVLAELEGCSDCRSLARAWASSSVDACAEPPPEARSVPASVGAYELRELIGSGAMGLVFRAWDTVLDRDVAVKVVRASDGDDRASLAEGRLLATVRHPNVIAVHAAGVGNGIAFIAMELVAGTSLDRVLRERERSSIDAATALRWFGGVASGLAAAHEAGVVHRDIKPANLLLDRSRDGDRLRIADFGLASTGPRAPAGTPGYVAPEVIDGEPATPASDQFSFCATLFETLAGRRPFVGAELAELRAGWQRGVRDWAGIPTYLRPILERGLASDPVDRWPDMRALEQALARSAKKRWWPWLVVAAIVLVATLSIVVFTRARGEACATPAVDWSVRSPAFAAYEARWREAYTRACKSPRGAAARDCLARVRSRVEDLLALGSDARPSQAIAKLAGPERCLVSPDGERFDPQLRFLEALATAGRTREARAALPPPGSDGAALALLRGRLAAEAQDFDAAEDAFRHAVTLATSANELAILADAQIELAIVVGFSRDHHDAGAAYAESGRATAERIDDPRRTALANIASGLVLAARGDDRAIATMTSAVEALAQQDPDPLELANAEKRVAWVLRERHRGAEARRHLAVARELRARVLGEDSVAVAEIDVEVGMTEAADGELAAAIRHERAVIARLEALLGRDAYELAGALSALGAAQINTGDYAGGEASLRRVLALRLAKLGIRHEDVARAYLNLANALYYQAKYEPAIELYRAAAATARSALGGNHPQVATIELALGVALQGVNRSEEAAVAIAGAIAVFRAGPGRDLELGDALLTLGGLELGRGNLPASRAALEESYAITLRVRGADHVDLAYPLSALGELYLAMNRLDDAARSTLRARELRAAHGFAPQRIAESDFVLAEIVAKQGKRADARAYAKRALDELGTDRPELRTMIEAWLKKLAR